jgi:hypothetical protein
MKFGGNYNPEPCEIDSIFFSDLMIMIDNYLLFLKFLDDKIPSGPLNISGDDQIMMLIPSYSNRCVSKILKAKKNFQTLYVLFTNQYNGIYCFEKKNIFNFFFFKVVKGLSLKKNFFQLI